MEDLDEVAWDLGLPQNTSSEDIHAALKVKAEELTHAQEACCGIDYIPNCYGIAGGILSMQCTEMLYFCMLVMLLLCSASMNQRTSRVGTLQIP